jgi:hypothetical protein
MRTLQERGIQVRDVQLLREEALLQLHQELAAADEDIEACHMQELLEQHEEENRVQEQEGSGGCAGEEARSLIL